MLKASSRCVTLLYSRFPATWTWVVPTQAIIGRIISHTDRCVIKDVAASAAAVGIIAVGYAASETDRHATTDQSHCCVDVHYVYYASLMQNINSLGSRPIGLCMADR